MQIGSGRSHASDSGAKVIIYPGDILFASFAAARATLQRLRDGEVGEVDASLATELNRVIGSPEATAAAERYGVVARRQRATA